MQSLGHLRRAGRLGLPFGLLFVAATGLAACKKQASDRSAATPHRPAACDQYAARLCERAGGKESATCESMQSTIDLLPEQACTAGLEHIDYSLSQLARSTQSCEDLKTRLCTELGPNSESCALVTAQTKELTPDRCKAMLGHVPELVSGLRKMQDAQKPLDGADQAAIAEGPAPGFGPASAPVRIVEFSDFQCPYCARAAEVVDRIQKDYGSRVRFVFREFPLSRIHPNAREAAEASLSANAQGKFWPYHDRLFRNQSALDRAGLERQAREAGLDLDAFKASLDQHQFAPQVDSDIRLGEKVEVDGTPTMFINGVRVPDPTNYDAVSKRIEAALRGDTPTKGQEPPSGKPAGSPPRG